MAEGSDNRRRHFILEGVTRTHGFRSPQEGGGGRKPIPALDRARHGGALRGQLASLQDDAAAAREAQESAGLSEDRGLTIEFESFPEIELAFESLAYERSGIELLNVRHREGRTYANVFVPDGKLVRFERMIEAYLSEKHDKAGRSRDHQRLIDAIARIRKATLDTLWTDNRELLPTAESEAVWWEVWLPVRGNREAIVQWFRERAEALGMRVAPGDLKFPERTVLLAYASRRQLEQSMMTLNNIAELRRPKETADFFDSFSPAEQVKWVEELLERTSFAAPGSASIPHVCILDTGVNRGHPLLEPGLEAEDLHTVEPAWDVDDSDGHGSRMAGLSLVGDLTDHLIGSDPIEVAHRLESVKLLPHGGANQGDSWHHGHLTVEAILRPEISEPTRRRLFAMAVTARDDRDRGRPTAWSAAIDRMAADAEEFGERPRLLIVSGGNVVEPADWARYPESNDTDSIHDPAQAWNALTIGAFTELVELSEEEAGPTPIAEAGGLSPFSTTSLTWGKGSPLKPELVLEGGNAAKDSEGAFSALSLSLLTTHHRPIERLFTTANATSAATALAARAAAEIMATYPELWPETVRALLVHSGRWTEAMRKAYLPTGRKPSKAENESLVRRCGFGVPDLERALWSVQNSLTLVVQERVQPFQREGSKPPKLRNMNLHELPWPRETLLSLGETDVEMRVALSYFIEPNPSTRGTHSRYRYPSHGLRFDIQRRGETAQSFLGRVNAAAERTDEEGSGGSDPNWLIGKQARHAGSLHVDIWHGTAADLASRSAIAVYPAMGWWKSRPPLKCYDREARYALVVSIETPAEDVDLYAEIESQIAVPVCIEV